MQRFAAVRSLLLVTLGFCFQSLTLFYSDLQKGLSDLLQVDGDLWTPWLGGGTLPHGFPFAPPF